MENFTIGVVGVCGSGKSTLVEGLEKAGYRAKQIAQEHSFAPQMWQRLGKTDLLVYLHASYPLTLHRKSFNWREDEYQEQLYRLRHAVQYADLTIDTDHRTPEEVLAIVLRHLGDEQLPRP